MRIKIEKALTRINQVIMEVKRYKARKHILEERNRILMNMESCQLQQIKATEPNLIFDDSDFRVIRKFRRVRAIGGQA